MRRRNRRISLYFPDSSRTISIVVRLECDSSRSSTSTTGGRSGIFPSRRRGNSGGSSTPGLPPTTVTGTNSKATQPSLAPPLPVRRYPLPVMRGETMRYCLSHPIPRGEHIQLLFVRNPRPLLPRRNGQRHYRTCSFSASTPDISSSLSIHFCVSSRRGRALCSMLNCRFPASAAGVSTAAARSTATGHGLEGGAASDGGDSYSVDSSARKKMPARGKPKPTPCCGERAKDLSNIGEGAKPGWMSGWDSMARWGEC